jgi:hypothetical protein
LNYLPKILTHNQRVGGSPEGIRAGKPIRAHEESLKTKSPEAFFYFEDVQEMLI